MRTIIWLGVSAYVSSAVEQDERNTFVMTLSLVFCIAQDIFEILHFLVK